MEKPLLPLAGGFGAAVMLAFALNPFATDSGHTANPEPASTTAEKAESASAAQSASYALSENEQGPWYAVCKVFSTIDPEDLVDGSHHSVPPESGVDLHPPPSRDAERISEEIKEETITQGKVQRKYTPTYHYKGDLATCIPPGETADQIPIDFMIAIMPDPLGSHLSLQFDRDIVAIERAATANSYGFERYWFPWNGILRLERTGRIDAGTEALKRHIGDEPGVLIFRQFYKSKTRPQSIYSRRVFVFLVGETPTAGINKIALTKAITYIAQLQRRLQPCTSPHGRSYPCPVQQIQLPILGPTFSASFAPLFRSLYDMRQQDRKLHVIADVTSPSTTVEGIRETFQREIGEHDTVTDTALGTFSALAPTDCSSQAAMLEYLHHLGYEDSEVVYLNEDETPYHPDSSADPLQNPSSCASHAQKLATLTYPRDLSALRNTSQPTSITITPADIEGEAVKTQIAPFSLREQMSNELDSPTAFATEQAATDIDQALSNIVTTIRHQRYRVVIVTASNPLDEVYLLQYIRSNAPDVRLATFDQDSLMLRATNYQSLRGTISVTSFPLVETMKFSGVTLSDLPNSGTEAVFIAADQILSIMQNSPYSHNLASFVSPVDCQRLSTDRDYLNSSGSAWKNSWQPLQFCDTLSFIPFLQIAKQVWRLSGRDLESAPLVQTTAQEGLLCANAKELCDSLGEHPGTYILGNDSFWPMGGTEPREPYQVILPVTPHIWNTFILATIGLCAFHIYRYRRCYCHEWARGFDGTLWEYLFLIANNQILLLLFLLILPTFALRTHVVSSWMAYLPSSSIGIFPESVQRFAASLFQCVAWLLTATPFVLLAVFVSTSLWVWIHLWRRSKSAKSALKPFDKIVPIPYVLSTSVMSWLLVFGQDSDKAQTSAIRMMYVLDGLSPVPVIVSVLAVWYLFGATALTTMQNAKDLYSNPSFGSKPGHAWASRLMCLQKPLHVKNLVSPNNWEKLWFCIGAIMVIALQGWRALRGLDFGCFRGWVVLSGLCLVAIFVAVMFGRTWKLWCNLRELLAHLCTCPFAAGFERLPKDITSVKLWRPAERHQVVLLHRHSIQVLRQIADRAPYSMRSELNSYAKSAENYLDEISAKDQSITVDWTGAENTISSHLDGVLEIGKGGWFRELCERKDTRVSEYVASRYVALIKYVNAQMRWMLSVGLYGYVLLIIGCKTYPFQGTHMISSILTIIFTFLFVMSAVMFIQMDSNSLLTELEHNTEENGHYVEGVLRFLTVGGIPLIAVLASQFPAIERFLLSWVRPTIESLH